MKPLRLFVIFAALIEVAIQIIGGTVVIVAMMLSSH
jgi:hypothetical protein